MSHSIFSIEDFMVPVKAGSICLIDSRSESEFNHATIPGAINIPLLKNEERHIVGTIFKQQGKEAAMLKGFELVGPRFHEIITKANSVAPAKEILLFCWRGGMRSEIMSWLLSTAGFRVFMLKGGYKAYRNWVLDIHKIKHDVLVLGGKTGSGKTDFLLKLKDEGEQVLDLEDLAGHKGSAFGGLGKNPQPSIEQFENNISMNWSAFKTTKPVWIENESRSIGSCIIPDSIYSLIRDSDLIDINVDHQKRIDRITKDYGYFPVEKLIEITGKIKKRLGPQNCKLANEKLSEGNFNEWLEIILAYYDRFYEYGNSLRNISKFHSLQLGGLSEQQVVEELIRTGYRILHQNKIISD